MKKIVIIALMAILPFGAFAQKFGHVNTADIIPLMSEYKAAQTEMEELIKQYQDELNYMQEEYQKKEDDYVKMDSQQKIREYLESCQYNKDMKEAQLMDAINAKVLKAIQAVGEEGSYVCIFNLAGGAVPFVSSTLTTDVTEAVKAKLGMK